MATLEKRREYIARLKAKDPRKFRDKAREYMWKLLGMPLPTRPEPDVCECCGRPENRKHKDGTTFALSCDHDDAKKVFRGWLCTKCNHAIGLLGDDIEGVSNAVVYLMKTCGV